MHEIEAETSWPVSQYKHQHIARPTKLSWNWKRLFWKDLQESENTDQNPKEAAQYGSRQTESTGITCMDKKWKQRKCKRSEEWIYVVYETFGYVQESSGTKYIMGWHVQGKYVDSIELPTTHPTLLNVVLHANKTGTASNWTIKKKKPTNAKKSRNY